MTNFPEQDLALSGVLGAASHIAAINWEDPTIVAALIAVVAAAIGALIRYCASPPQSESPKPISAPVLMPAPPSAEWAVRIPLDAGIYYRRRKAKVADDFGKENPDENDAKVLVVLVHGILGDAIGTWGALADLMRDATRVEFDVLSYAYPAGILHSASINRGAAVLSSALRDGRFRNYEHLVFITHSTGGLLLKHVFKQDYQETLQQLANDEKRIGDVRSIAFRARQIINIAVPHSGGSFGASICLIPVYHLLFPLFVVVMGGCILLQKMRLRRSPPKGYAYGYNKIVRELWWRNRGLRKLETEYQQWVEEFDLRKLPRPVSVEVNGVDDATIAKGDNHTTFSHGTRETSRKNTAGHLFRGTHPTVKHATSVHDTIVVFLAQFLTRYENATDIFLAQETIKRSLLFDRDSMLVGAKQATQAASREAQTQIQPDK